MKTFIIANWKMNPQKLTDAKLLLDPIIKQLKNTKKTEIIICPPFLYLPIVKEQIEQNIKLGAQNCFWEKQGAYTGEISLLMLKNIGCKYVIIGHSERRTILNESNQMINKKIVAALDSCLKPIFCVGEKKQDKEKNKISIVIKNQIEQGLKKITKKQILDIVFAYEPIWAIGTGKSCLPDEAKVARLLLQKIIAKKYSNQLAQKIQIIYGGSVNSLNAKDFIKEAGFQGVLIGGASLNAKEFVKITEIFN